MISHLVLFRWNDQMDAERLAALGVALDELAATVPTVRAYRHGRDLGFGPTNFDYGVVATFDDVEGWRTYDGHPAHHHVRGELLLPFISERAAIQFES